MALRQSFCFPCFENSQWPFEALCEAAADIGYPAVEWWFRDERFAERVATARQHGLTVACMCGHESLTSGLNDPEQHDRITAELEASITLAAENGIPNLICFSGNRLDNQADADAIEHCAQALRRVAPLAESAGVMLNIELLNSAIDHPGYQCDHTAAGAAVCERVASPNVKLLYDIYHMQIMEGDVIRTIQNNIQWIGHFHTAGNPGRHDLDADQELNYPAICKVIDSLGYSGYLAHEFHPKGDPVAALKAAFTTCAGITS
jgi:hydroxypyruvate isomerase